MSQSRATVTGPSSMRMPLPSASSVCTYLVPVRHALVGDARSDVEHDNRSLSADVVTITQTTYPQQKKKKAAGTVRTGSRGCIQRASMMAAQCAKNGAAEVRCRRTEFLLSGSVPAVVDNLSERGGERQRVHLHTHGG